MTEVRTTFTSWAYLSARLYADDRLEVEWIVGPLPDIGKRVTEIIIRYHIEGPGVRPTTAGKLINSCLNLTFIPFWTE